MGFWLPLCSLCIRIPIAKVGTNGVNGNSERQFGFTLALRSISGICWCFIEYAVIAIALGFSSLYPFGTFASRRGEEGGENGCRTTLEMADVVCLDGCFIANGRRKWTGFKR